jgi:RNA polymerase sigma-70 factor (ECF subfamily)
LLNPKTQNQAFQQLLRDYQRPLYNHVRSIVLNHDDDADDVLQNFYKNFSESEKF